MLLQLSTFWSKLKVELRSIYTKVHPEQSTMDISTYIVLCPVCINPAMNQLPHGFPLKPSATQSLQTKDTLCTREHSLKCFPQMDSLRLLAGIISCLQILHQNQNISWILSDCFLGSSEHSSEKDKKDTMLSFLMILLQLQVSLLLHCNQIFKASFWQSFLL